MNTGYTKLHSSLISSTIWREPHTTRIVWITMLAMADQHGEIMASIPGLADLCRVSVGECEEALSAFLAPDKYSRTTSFEGRRIEKIEGGWSLLNHPKYRMIASKEDAKVKASERTARYRRNKALRAIDSDGVSMVSRDIAEAEAEAEADKENKAASPVCPPPPKQPKEPKYHPEARTALHYLNEKSGRTFREVDPNLTIITARMREPDVTLEGVKQMIDRQCALWKQKPEMVEYLRPETLFGKQKFDSYYSARELPVVAQVERQERAPSINDLRTVLEAKKSERGKVFNRGHENALGWTAASEEDRKLMGQLNREIADLMHRISIQKV